MKSIRWFKKIRLITIVLDPFPILVFLFSLFLYVPFSRLGVDVHHDGIMAASALLVRNGFRVQSEVYNQYGPVSNWLQSIELLIFGDRLIVLRVFSAIALAASAAITYVASNRFFGRTVALGAVVLWVVCAPFFDIDMQMLPWSSDYLLLGNCLAILLASSIYLKSNQDQRKTIGIGFILGINCFIKVHPSALILLAVVCCTFLFIGVRQAWRLVQGVFFAFLIVLILLCFYGSVADWWFQAISMPRDMYKGFFQSGLDGLKANILVNGVSGLFSLGLCLWFAKSIFELKNVKDLKSILVHLLRVISLLMLWWIFNIDKGYTILNPRLFLWSVVLGSIIFGVVWIERIRTVDMSERFPLIVLTAISIGSLFQIFPMVDRRHLWWSTLPALVMLLAQIQRNQRKEVRKILVIILLVSITWPALAHANSTLDVKRVKVENAEFLNGMLVSKDFDAAFGGYINLISQYQALHGDRTMLTFCADGLFTTLGRTSKQPDPYFVYWIFPQNVYDHQIRLSFIQKFRPMIWVCWPYVDYEVPLSDFGYRIVHRPECLNGIDRFNSFGLSGFLAIPNEWPMIMNETGLEKEDVCTNL